MNRLFCFMLCFVCVNAFSYGVLKYYDPINAKADYQGVLQFTHDISNINLYFTNGWNYYMVYYRNGSVVKYQYIGNGNILREGRYVYRKNVLKAVVEFIRGKKFSTLFMVSPLRTKTFFHNTGNYIISNFSGDNKLITVNEYSKSKTLQKSTSIKYDKEGREYLHVLSDRNGIQGYVEFLYDLHGLKSKILFFDEKKNLQILTSLCMKIKNLYL